MSETFRLVSDTAWRIGL